ncbi:Tetratricopeptide repeat-containing protein [Sphingobium faniae]|nr:Tetratricopeptide repeat-containing protein [Sphingobium faniae]
MSANPHHERDLLLQEARRLRSRQQVPAALATLARLQSLYPGFSRLYQERGHCHVLLRDAPAAIEALREAVRLNPTLPASWDMLEQLYRMSGDPAQAAMAAQNLAILKQLPQELVVANSLFADGDLPLAEDIIRDYLRTDGGNVGALRLLARLCTERNALAEAETLLESAVELALDYEEARFDLAAILLLQQKHQQAWRQTGHLLTHDPSNRDYLKQHCAACIALGDHEPVVDLCEKLLLGPSLSGAEVADLRLWRANALKVTGRQEEAVSDYHASLAARRDYGVAWFSLANLKTYSFTDAEIAQMRNAAGRSGMADMDSIYLCFALGKALEDRGDFAASWEYYERGNSARRRIGRYNMDSAEACAARSKRMFDAAFFSARSGWGVDDPAPIFIIGLPRSGSTLIEQILASHSKVEGTQELVEIGRYASELCGSDPDCDLPLSPEALQRLTAQGARALGERFLAETRAYRRLGRPYFIDKMPNNFWHVGLIHLILPRSTIIDVRREPMACCFSNLKQLFGTTNQEFTYGADDIARYYRVYLDMMRHWDDVLPGRVLRIPYEDVVEDLDSSTRRMLAHVGLPFEPACLAFHQTRRSVRTPSSEQVRQPISREGLTQWRNYAPWLDGLRAGLGDALTRYRN